MNIFYKVINKILNINVTNAQLSGGNNSGNSGLDYTIINPLSMSGSSVADIVDAVVDLLLKIGAAIAALMYIWAGFQFLTAGGDEKKISTAKKTLVWTTIGIAVLVLSKGIILSVETLLTP